MSNRPTLEKSRVYLNELFKNGVQQDINISTVKFVDKSGNVIHDMANDKLKDVYAVATDSFNKFITNRDS